MDAPNTEAQISVHPKDTVQAGCVSVPTGNQDLVGPNQRSLNSRAIGAEKQDWVSTNKQTKKWNKRAIISIYCLVFLPKFHQSSHVLLVSSVIYNTPLIFHNVHT